MCVRARATTGFGAADREGETVTSGFTYEVTPSDAVSMNTIAIVECCRQNYTNTAG